MGRSTVWQGLAGEIANQGRNPDGFSSVVVGGSGRAAFDDRRKSGASVCHAWGMTEMSPIGTQGNLPVSVAASDIRKAFGPATITGPSVWG